MSDTVMTFKIEERLRNQFSMAAQSLDKTEDQLLQALVQDFVRDQRKDPDYEEWLRRKVEKSMAEIDAGLYCTSEEVEAEAAEWRAAMLTKLGQQKL